MSWTHKYTKGLEVYIYMAVVYIYIYIYSAIWLFHGQLWAIIKGTVSLSQC